MRGNYAAFPYVVFFILLISVAGPGVLPQTSFVYVIDIELFWLTALPERASMIGTVFLTGGKPKYA